jgi:hypothetical protein
LDIKKPCHDLYFLAITLPKKKEKTGDFRLVCGNSNKIAQKLENSPKFQNHKIEKQELHLSPLCFLFSIFSCHTQSGEKP